MIVDSSAILAILRAEQDAGLYAEAIHAAPVSRISAANYLEAAVVMDASRNPVLSRKFDQFIRRSEIRIEAVTAGQAMIAREAYRDFGKGSGHPARLNFGDCFAYALAVDASESLLFKGKDFIHTDVTAAIRP